MGKNKHEGKGRNISVSGGQERKDLFKDMSGGYNAMGDSNTPNYKYNGSVAQQRYSAPMEKHGPLHGNAFVGAKVAAEKAGKDSFQVDGKSFPVQMKGSPMYKRKHQVYGVDSKASEPKGSMKGLNKKTAPKMPEPKKENSYGKVQTMMKTVRTKTSLEMKGSTSPTYKNAPYKLMGDPNKKMDKLSARHKKLYDRFEMGQTSEAEEQKMYKLEDKMNRVGKRIKKKKS